MEMAVRYKVFGRQEYAYRIWNEKNPETKKWKQRSEYLGVVVDKARGIYEKRNKIKQLAREAEAARQPIFLNSAKFRHQMAYNPYIATIVVMSKNGFLPLTQPPCTKVQGMGLRLKVVFQAKAC